MKSFIRYFGGTVVRPFSTFESLPSDPKGFAKGFRAILIPAVLFTITSGLLAVGGALLPAPAVLPLGGENYYFYQIFFALPVLLAAWAVAAVVARLLGSRRRGTGTLRGTLAALGFAFGLPALAAWIGQAIFAALILAGMSQEEFMELTAAPGPARTVAFAGQAFIAAWILLLSVAAVRAGLKIRWKAIPVGILAAAIFLASVLICLR
jgi:hypothetical protein